ncbi:MAG TPA: helix-turn-helix transcriptional regulator [Rubrobacteraceae bacterium]|nr:helix-turn-helix transcriptional regulator [Rubrobacteraceae bacterium]
MSESSLAMDRAFSEVKRLCYAGLDEKALLREAAERTRRAVPLELYCMLTNDPSSGLVTMAVLSDPEYGAVARHALEQVQFEDEVAPFGWMVERRLAALTLSESTGGKPERALRYREVMVPLGVEHEVRGVFALDGELWGSVSAMREPASPDFDAREVAFFRRVAPHLAAGLKAAVLRSEALAEPDGDGSPGVLVLDRAGRVVQYTAAAERWLRELGDLGPGWRYGVGLPAAVLSVRGALKRTLGQATERESGSVLRLLVRGRSGRWLALHGAWTEPNAGRGSETVVVIEAAGPREVAWLRTSAYGLTKREREVVDLVVRGASTREISRALYISEHTVQEHLSNVFEKVGERGRRALVRRLYLDGLA